MTSTELRPQASSTPSIVKKVSGRMSIHRDFDQGIPSPVQMAEIKRKKQDYPNEDSEESEEEPLITFECAKIPKRKETRDTKPQNNSKTKLLKVYHYITKYKDKISTATLYLTVLLFLLIPSHSVQTNKTEIVNSLKLKYPSQDPRLWFYFSSGISDTQRFNKPSVIVVMYTEDTEPIAEEIARNMSAYACDKLANLENPIVLRSSDLNTAEYQQDYGRIIADFKPRLEKRRVMVVKDFDKLNPNVARAFHSICDEYTPLVGQAFYIFMVKVRSYVGREVDQIGSILRQYWGELDEDILDPLIARVTNVVLRVIPEL